MTISAGFRQLAAVLEEVQANGLDVLDVTTTDDDENRRLLVDLTVAVPLGGSEPSAVDDETSGTTDDAGDATDDPTTERDGAATRPDPEPDDARAEVLDALPVTDEATNGAAVPEPAPKADEGDDSPEEPEAADDDAVTCPVADCDATFESDHGMKIHRTKVHGDETDGSDPATPAYRDPDRLREVYDDCDSFTEMREALETDVSAQTVRRQMIAHGIYEPDCGEGSSGDGDREICDEGEADASDDPSTESTSGDDPSEERSELETIELPEGVTVADLKAGVCGAKTLYDVQQRFDLDREEAMQLLERYELLEVVHGRVSDRDRRKEVDEDEITRRILEHAPVSRASRV